MEPIHHPPPSAPAVAVMVDVHNDQCAKDPVLVEAHIDSEEPSSWQAPQHQPQHQSQPQHQPQHQFAAGDPYQVNDQYTSGQQYPQPQFQQVSQYSPQSLPPQFAYGGPTIPLPSPSQPPLHLHPPPVKRAGWMKRLKFKSNDMPDITAVLERNVRTVFGELLFANKWIVLKEGCFYTYGVPADNADMGYDLREVHCLRGCRVRRVDTRLVLVAATGIDLCHLKSCQEGRLMNSDLEMWESSIAEHISFRNSSSVR